MSFSSLSALLSVNTKLSRADKNAVQVDSRYHPVSVKFAPFVSDTFLAAVGGCGRPSKVFAFSQSTCRIFLLPFLLERPREPALNVSSASGSAHGSPTRRSGAGSKACHFFHSLHARLTHPGELYWDEKRRLLDHQGKQQKLRVHIFV